jgi:hypothetical protein
MLPVMTRRASIGWRSIRVALALVLLNSALTFANVWPTLGVHWRGELSVELAAMLVMLAAGHVGGRPIRRRWLVLLSVGLVLLAIGRYADVTSPALYGRPINLFWDLPHVGEVVGMLARVASRSELIALGLLVPALLGALYLLARWSLGEVDETMRLHSVARSGLGVGAGLLVACFLTQQFSPRVPRAPRFSIPVSQTYGVQIERAVSVMSGIAARSLPPAPQLHSNFRALRGDDVLLIFVESYGRTTYDRPEFLSYLNPVRQRLQAAINDTGRQVVSAYVTSPTFAGTSVLAHLSLLSGTPVRDMRRYQLLMTQHRPSLVSAFRSANYRAIALMPGNQHPWPEGSFYGFDRIYDAQQLDYRGPQFGWWHIPDQYSLEYLDVNELQAQPRRPLFVFFPTLSTHMPFRPTPPLQADWPRMLSTHPFDAAPLQAAMSRTPQWTHLGESYVGAVRYFFDTFADFLRRRPDEHCVVILLGDHQPASSVSGEGASWDVPVHVISSNPAILAALRARGFAAGLTPSGAALGDMHQLAQWLLAAFNDPTAAVTVRPGTAAILDSVASQPDNVEEK